MGKFLDPIADKILVIVAMLILVEAGRLPAWIPAIVVIREFIVSGYRTNSSRKARKGYCGKCMGKNKTCTQMLGLTIAFLDVHSFGAIFTESLTGGAYVLNLATTLLLGISVIATIFSGIDYLKGCKEIFRKKSKILFWGTEEKTRERKKTQNGYRASEKKSRGVSTFIKLLYTNVILMISRL